MTRSVSRRLAVTLGVLTLLAGLLASVAGVALAATSTVQLNNNLFVPQNLGNIAAGDTITWQNVNGTHDVTSANIPAGAATWASPLLSGSATFSRTFTVAGNYRYLCTIHASVAEANAATQDPTKMVGQFTVVAGTTPTPTPTPPTPTPTPPTPTPTPPTPTPTPTAESTPTPPPTDIATLSDSTSGNPPFLFVGIFLAALGLALLLTPARRRKR